MLIQDPDTGETYDDSTGEGSSQTTQSTPSAYVGNGLNPADDQGRIDSIILPDFQSLLSRPPTASEIQQALSVYRAQGGDVMREYIVGLRGEGGSGFTWGPDNWTGGGYSAGSYTPGQWQEAFNSPTVEDMLKDPGYRTRMDEMQRGTERTAAAKGSILSGGFVGRTLPRVLGEAASQEYGNTFSRAYDQYKQRYGQFSDAQDRDANAFAMNETGKLNQYQTRYTSYRDVVKDRQYEEDAQWQREQDLARLGLSAAGG